MEIKLDNFTVLITEKDGEFIQQTQVQAVLLYKILQVLEELLRQFKISKIANGR